MTNKKFGLSYMTHIKNRKVIFASKLNFKRALQIMFLKVKEENSLCHYILYNYSLGFIEKKFVFRKIIFMKTHWNEIKNESFHILNCLIFHI